MTNRMSIAVLWAILVVSMMAHTIQSLMPLFFGIDIAKEGTNGVMEEGTKWFFLAVFSLPIACGAMTTLFESKWKKISGLALALGFAAMNVMHVIAEITHPLQDVIMLLLTALISLALAWKSWLWYREPNSISA